MTEKELFIKQRLRSIESNFEPMLSLKQNIRLLKEECNITTTEKELKYLLSTGIIKPRTIEDTLQSLREIVNRNI